MSVPFGFRPDRIRTLLARTGSTIEDLAAIDCADPAAADALRTLRLTRHNLEDLWMPLLRQIERSDAMTNWRAALLPVTAPNADVLDRLRQEWTSTAAWSSLRPSETRRWSDERLIEAVIAHDDAWRADVDGAFEDPTSDAGGEHDDLFVDAMHEIARRVSIDPAFAESLLARAGHTATLGVMVAHATFGRDFTAAVGRRLLGPGVSEVLPARRERHAAVTGMVLDTLSAWPEIALELLGEPTVRDALVWRHDLPTEAVREFVAAGMHLAVRSDPGALQESLDALVGFVPLSRRTTFPDGLAQGIAAAVGTHMTHLAPLLDPGTHAFVDVVGTGVLEVDGEPVGYDDLQSLYGRVVRGRDAQILAELGLADYLDERLRELPAAIEKSSASVRPPTLGTLLRVRIEPAVLALGLVFGAAATFEQQRIDNLHAQRRGSGDRSTSVGLTLLSFVPGGNPVSKVLHIAEQYLPSPQDSESVPDNDVLADLDGVVAREALLLLVAYPELRAAAGLDVVDEATWRVLQSAATDPTVEFANRGTLMHRLQLTGPDALLVETFLAEATGTATATVSPGIPTGIRTGTGTP